MLDMFYILSETNKISPSLKQNQKIPFLSEKKNQTHPPLILMERYFFTTYKSSQRSSLYPCVNFSALSLNEDLDYQVLSQFSDEGSQASRHKWNDKRQLMISDHLPQLHDSNASILENGTIKITKVFMFIILHVLHHWWPGIMNRFLWTDVQNVLNL